MLDTVAAWAPTLIPYVSYCCLTPSPVFTQTSIISSSEGLQQGDPLSPFLFAMTTHWLFKKISLVPGTEWSTWFLDDGTLIGNAPGLQSSVDVLRSEGPYLGLTFNTSKSCLKGPGASQELSHLLGDIPILRCETCKWAANLLGAPIGDCNFVALEFNKRLQSVESKCSALHNLHNPQAALAILRWCLSACRVNFLFRAVPPSQSGDWAAKYDALLRTSFESLICGIIPDSAWLQATLPMRCGGLGILSPVTSFSTAFNSFILCYYKDMARLPQTRRQPKTRFEGCSDSHERASSRIYSVTLRVVS